MLRSKILSNVCSFISEHHWTMIGGHDGFDWLVSFSLTDSDGVALRSMVLVTLMGACQRFLSEILCLLVYHIQCVAYSDSIRSCKLWARARPHNGCHRGHHHVAVIKCVATIISRNNLTIGTRSRNMKVYTKAMVALC